MNMCAALPDVLDSIFHVCDSDSVNICKTANVSKPKGVYTKSGKQYAYGAYYILATRSLLFRTF